MLDAFRHVGEGLHSLGLQCCQKRLAAHPGLVAEKVRRQHVEAGLSALSISRQLQETARRQRLPQIRSVLAAHAHLAVETLDLAGKQRRNERTQAEGVDQAVHTGLVLLWKTWLSAASVVLAHHRCLPEHVLVGGHQKTRLRCGQQLATHAAETRRVGKRAHHLPADSGAMGLAAVLDHLQAVLPRDAVDGRHVCRLAVEMHHEHRFGLRRDGLFDLLRIQQATDAIDVGEDGHGSDRQDTRGRRPPRTRRRDHFVAVTDLQSHESAHQRCVPRVDGEHVAPPVVDAEIVFRLADDVARTPQGHGVTRLQQLHYLTHGGLVDQRPARRRLGHAQWLTAQQGELTAGHDSYRPLPRHRRCFEIRCDHFPIPQT